MTALGLHILASGRPGGGWLGARSGRASGLHTGVNSFGSPRLRMPSLDPQLLWRHSARTLVLRVLAWLLGRGGASVYCACGCRARHIARHHALYLDSVRELTCSPSSLAVSRRSLVVHTRHPLAALRSAVCCGACRAFAVSPRRLACTLSCYA